MRRLPASRSLSLSLALCPFTLSLSRASVFSPARGRESVDTRSEPDPSRTRRNPRFSASKPGSKQTEALLWRNPPLEPLFPVSPDRHLLLGPDRHSVLLVAVFRAGFSGCSEQLDPAPLHQTPAPLTEVKALNLPLAHF
ncbi:uncharacterized protein V6R79_024513 [Siganus canaliculatus]